jgi:hypothetical protein
MVSVVDVYLAARSLMSPALLHISRSSPVNKPASAINKAYSRFPCDVTFIACVDLARLPHVDVMLASPPSRIFSVTCRENGLENPAALPFLSMFCIISGIATRQGSLNNII